jgi:hypothetical protein
MTVVSTLDVHGLTAQEYRAVMGMWSDGGRYRPRITSSPRDSPSSRPRGVASGSAKRECRFESLINCENNESQLVIEAVGS